jgi:cullin 3
MHAKVLNRDEAITQWATIKDAIVKIYAQQASQLSYEELYRTAYNLVLHKHGEMLYDNVRKTTIEMLQPIVTRLQNTPDEEMVKEITLTWDHEKYVIIMIRDILLYMDKNFVPKMKNFLNVEAMQTTQFKN